MRWICRLRRSLVRDPLFHDKRGASALEYALAAAVIGGVVISAATSLGNSLSAAYGSLGASLTSQANSM